MATMLLPPEFKRFLSALASHKVEYLIVGGYAVIYRKKGLRPGMCLLIAGVSLATRYGRAISRFTGPTRVPIS